jgi:DNA polymerase III delta subunit
MIYIVHGEDLSYSRNIILNQQKKLGSPARTEISLSKTTPEHLKEISATFDIFGTPPFIVLDISDAGRMNLDKYVDAISKIPAETVLIVLSAKELSKSNAFIKNSQKLGAKIIHAVKKPTSNVFKFIDYVFSGNRSPAYKELKRLTLDDEDPFYLISMLLYGLRNIAYVKFNSPEFNKVSPFAKNKARNQAKHYTKEAVRNLFAQFYKADKNLKTGELSPEVALPFIIEKVFYART